MKILVTGANGFIGKNLISTLHENDYEIYKYDKADSLETLFEFTKDCDFVFNLAGVNRPQNNEEFYEGNTDFVATLTQYLKENNNNSPIVITSSIQVEMDNDYGKSKLEGENFLKEYGISTDTPIYIYRLTNVFGKWCKPNYNSVIATWCYNIQHNLPVQVNDPNVELELIYIDDIINSFLEVIDEEKGDLVQYRMVKPSYKRSLGEIHDLLYSFKKDTDSFFIPNLQSSFNQKLYSTFLSYKSEDQLSYTLKMNVDERGSFTEVLKSNTHGQVSINVSKPGIIKGNHWHHSKNEKFIAVSGAGVIRLRNIFDDNIIEYNVSESVLEVIDIPPGYTHQILNTGDTDLVVLIWVNELLDKENPDTYYQEV